MKTYTVAWIWLGERRTLATGLNKHEAENVIADVKRLFPSKTVRRTEES